MTTEWVGALCRLAGGRDHYAARPALSATKVNIDV